MLKKEFTEYQLFSIFHMHGTMLNTGKCTIMYTTVFQIHVVGFFLNHDNKLEKSVCDCSNPL